MSEFKPGEIVNVTIEGVRIDDVQTDGTPDIIAEDSEGLATVWALPPQAKVERVASAEWPPQPGDLWEEVDGALWFAQSLGGFMQLVPAHARGSVDTADPDYVLETFGPLTLVPRRQGGERS